MEAQEPKISLRAICRECDSYFHILWLDDHQNPRYSPRYCPYCGNPLLGKAQN
jgi:hypothetical protein